MKIGIIAEFNPLHTGHTYLINTIKSEYPTASLYIIMSTYFTQRAEPSFIHPHEKVKLILKNGADFVFELPPFVSTQRADIFANGAISICKALQLDAIAFGVEDITFFTTGKKEADQQQIDTERPYLKHIHDFNTKQAQYAHWNPSANNILAHFYQEAAKAIYPSLRFLPIQREGALFHETKLKTSYASATAIRHAIQSKNDAQIESFIPYPTSHLHPFLTWDSLYRPFLHTLFAHDNLEKIATIGQSGLSYRFQKAASMPDFPSFINAVKTRAYTRTSIQRAMLFTFLNITQHQLDQLTSISYEIPPRLLGFHKGKTAELKMLPICQSIHQLENAAYKAAYLKVESLYHLYMKNDSQYFPFIFETNMT